MSHYLRVMVLHHVHYIRYRLKGCCSPGSGALPSAKLGHNLNDNQLRIGMAIRLGSPVSYPHKCVCGAEADGYGHHKLVCDRSSGRPAYRPQSNYTSCYDSRENTIDIGTCWTVLRRRQTARWADSNPMVSRRESGVGYHLLP